MAQAVIAVTVWRNHGRRGLTAALLLAVELKHNLGAHSRPDHLIQLQDREQPRDRPVVRNVVVIDVFALAGNNVAEMSGEFADPNTNRSCTGGQGEGSVSVDVAVLPVTPAIYCICKLLRHACGAVFAVYKLARQRLFVAFSCREIVIIMVKRSMEAAVVFRNSRNVVECAVQVPCAIKVCLPISIRARFDLVKELAG